MFVVTGGRASGKTSAIVRWLLENPMGRGVVVLNEQRRTHLLRMLQDRLPRHDWRPHVISIAGIDLRGLPRRGRLFGFHEMAVDDLQEVFTEMFGSDLEFATLNATWLPLGGEEPVKAEAEYYPTALELIDRELNENPPTSKKKVAPSPMLAVRRRAITGTVDEA